jgi:hemerythrin superfamily protein
VQTTDQTTPAAQSAGQLPVNGANAVEILLNDHVRIKQLLNELVASHEQAERIRVLEQLKATLTVHNATEENLVYPALALLAGKKWESEKLYHETAMADTMLFQLDTSLKQGDSSKAEATAQALQKAILEHIDDEESKAFPHLQDRTEPMQQQMLTANVRQFRGAIRMQLAM